MVCEEPLTFPLKCHYHCHECSMLITIVIYYACIHYWHYNTCQLILRREVLSFPVFYISSLGFHVQVYTHVGIYTMQNKRPEMQESAPPGMCRDRRQSVDEGP